MIVLSLEWVSISFNFFYFVRKRTSSLQRVKYKLYRFLTAKLVDWIDLLYNRKSESSILGRDYPIYVVSLS